MIGTAGTIASGAYERAIKAIRPDATVSARACPLFVPLVEEGWFGPGEPHPRLPERIGDVALVMRKRYTVKDWITGEPRFLHIGNHGGTHVDEMSIPLIVEET